MGPFLNFNIYFLAYLRVLDPKQQACTSKVTWNQFESESQYFYFIEEAKLVKECIFVFAFKIMNGFNKLIFLNFLANTKSEQKGSGWSQRYSNTGCCLAFLLNWPCHSLCPFTSISFSLRGKQYVNLNYCIQPNIVAKRSSITNCSLPGNITQHTFKYFVAKPKESTNALYWA